MDILLTQTFNGYAVDYEQEFNNNPLGEYQRRRVQAIIKPYLEKGTRILDVGCGPGSDFAFYKSLGLTVDALDISREMVKAADQKARELNLPAAVSQCAFEAFRSEYRYRAVILNFGVINVFESLADILRKLQELLKPEGVLVVVAMPPVHWFSLFSWLLRLKFALLWQRVIRRQVELANGLPVYYYRQKDFDAYFRVIERIHLCPILPTPRQYQNRPWARFVARLLMPLDQRISHLLPDAWGGDHVCYILKSRNQYEPILTRNCLPTRYPK